MGIRISGLVSGYDTDSMVKELVKASSTKKDDLTKAQTKLSWKQDAWSAINTKIYSFFNTKLANLKMQGSFNKKTTTVADTSLASVIASENAVNGTQTLAVKQLAKSGYLTGGKLSENKSITSNTKLSELSGGSLGGLDYASVKVKSGSKESTITLSGNSTIADVVKQLNNAGVTASFDATNQRMFISASGSGTDSDFALTAQNANGLTALSSMGLLTSNEITNNPDYTTWAAMYADSDAAISGGSAFATQTAKDTASAAKSMLSNLTSYQAEIESLRKEREKLQDSLTEMKDQDLYKNAAGSTTTEKLENTSDSLNDVTDKLIYLNLSEKDSSELTDEEKSVLSDLQERAVDEGWSMPLNREDLEAQQTDLINTRKVLIDTSSLEGQIQNNLNTTKASEEYLADNSLVLKDYYNGLASAGDYSNISSTDVTDALTKIDEAFTYATMDAAATGMTVPASASYNLTDSVTAENIEKVKTAYNALHNTTISGASASAVRVMGQNAKISLNGAEYESSTNSFTVNGLTITAAKVSEITGQDDEGNDIYAETSINTSNDVDGIYNMIKDFFKEYNDLIKEMDSLYNAASSKGYEPLTDDEKDAMTDTEVTAWEKKIKDSLLRRDDTLSTVINTFKTGMLQSYAVGDTKYTLASFGIETLGYFSSADNEKGCYHIDGDSTDSSTSGDKDKLKTAIASNPDTVMNFFTQLTGNIYDSLNKQMQSSDYRSVYHVYDDKKMQEEYDDYKTSISKQETKLKDLEDRYYDQFSAMETAMSKLNSQQSALSSLLGSN